MTSSRSANPRLYSDNESPSQNSNAGSRSASIGLGESSIRPRNRRLLSTEQELVSTGSGRSTPSASRGVSPIPLKHPSRSTTTKLGDNQKGRSSSSGPAGALGGILEGGWTSSWTALQGLANTVLGGDVEHGSESRETRKGGRTERPKFRRKESNATGKLFDMPSGSWGPASQLKKNENAIGAGSVTEREAAARTRKMTRVLEGREELNGLPDTNGNYKRRTSTEEVRGQTDDGDALVYIHHVQPQDTLAGVILRYNCQPAVFKKANRFWPNDSIQIRKIVVLPVDACAIKGRPCESPIDFANRGLDLLAPTPGEEDAPPEIPGVSWPPSAANGTSSEQPQDEKEWVHVRWVLFDSSPNSKPVEIARMPRKALGYFPPRRRKSQVTPSVVSTPRASTDFPSISKSVSTSSNDPAGSAASTPSRRESNLGPRPSQSISGSYFPASGSSTRSRRQSVGEAADRWAWMRGPGGVGTLDKNVTMPGPGEDALNTWARKHIPGITLDSVQPSSLIGSEGLSFGYRDELASIAEGNGPFAPARSGSVTPSALISSTSGHGIGLENAAAAIEGWVRRLAMKAPGTPKLGGALRNDPGDLIELLDGTGSDDGRGFELIPPSLRSGTSGTNSSGREDMDLLIRGRATSVKGGKSD